MACLECLAKNLMSSKGIPSNASCWAPDLRNVCPETKLTSKLAEYVQRTATCWGLREGRPLPLPYWQIQMGCLLDQSAGSPSYLSFQQVFSRMEWTGSPFSLPQQHDRVLLQPLAWGSDLDTESLSVTFCFTWSNLTSSSERVSVESSVSEAKK